MSFRISFAGASGTGKTTLASWLAQELGLPLCPVGSRSVSKAMGFSSPYDVDAAGQRGAFQRRLQAEKEAWEKEHEASGFVTDRTHLDQLAYVSLHDIGTVDAALWRAHINACARYTHIFYCPVATFCQPAGDPARIQDLTYHRVYDTLLKGLLQNFFTREKLHWLDGAGVLWRRRTVLSCLELKYKLQ